MDELTAVVCLTSNLYPESDFTDVEEIYTCPLITGTLDQSRTQQRHSRYPKRP